MSVATIIFGAVFLVLLIGAALNIVGAIASHNLARKGGQCHSTD